MLTTACETIAEGESRLDDALVVQECRRAISARYFDVSGRMDIRRLWSRGCVHRFRVNWWKLRGAGFEQFIWRSAFVVVEETRAGFEVREMSAHLAA
jgi:hypothetical protein